MEAKPAPASEGSSGRWSEARKTMRPRAIPALVTVTPPGEPDRYGILVDINPYGLCVSCDPCPLGRVSVNIYPADGTRVSSQGAVCGMPKGDRQCHIAFEVAIGESVVESLLAVPQPRGDQKQFVNRVAEEDLKAVNGEVAHGRNRVSQIMVGSIASCAAVVTLAGAFGQQMFLNQNQWTVALASLLGILPLVAGLVALLVVLRQVNRFAAFAAAVDWYLIRNSLPETYGGWSALCNSLCSCINAPKCPATEGREACFSLAIKPAQVNSRKGHFLRLSSVMNDFGLCCAVTLLSGVFLGCIVGSSVILVFGTWPLCMLPVLLAAFFVWIMAANVANVYRGKFSFERYYYAWLHAVSCHWLPTTEHVPQQ